MLLATAMSSHGAILKIDSTKKICKKLQGMDANTASWTTNVGNERGKILMSVLTSSESVAALQPMAAGLMRRYEEHHQPPPQVLYTDRDCCTKHGQSKYRVLFSGWDLCMRLDVWHFMRRLANGCTLESHPLYGPFMSRLSAAIFEWDRSDYDLLLSAKWSELIAVGVSNPPHTAVQKAVSKEEMAKHCRRRTRGTKETVDACHRGATSLLLHGN